MVSGQLIVLQGRGIEKACGGENGGGTQFRKGAKMKVGLWSRNKGYVKSIHLSLLVLGLSEYLLIQREELFHQIGLVFYFHHVHP